MNYCIAMDREYLAPANARYKKIRKVCAFTSVEAASIVLFSTVAVQSGFNFHRQISALSILSSCTTRIESDWNTLYCVPGGDQFNVLCLHRTTGDLIWSSRGNGEPATCSSPALINHNGHEILVTVTKESNLGINTDSGNLRWSLPRKPLFVNHVNAPIYKNGTILFIIRLLPYGPFR
jgi:hypothetical protein